MSLRRHARQVVLAFVLALNACFGAFAQECEIRLMVANTSGFEVRAVGPRDEQFVLEWSTNLVSWATSETNQFEGCEQPVAPNYTPVFPPQTFYRVRRYEPGEGCAIGVCFKEIITNAIACPVYGPPDLATNRNASIPTGQTPVTTLRLTINVLAEDDGSNPAVPLSSVGEQVATLNADFLPHRIQFVAAVQVVTSSQFRGVASVADAQAMKQQWANNPAAQHNVFVTSVPLTLFFGYSTYPWDTNALAPLGGTVVNAQRFGRNEATLTHELGHALGLWHTHHGVTANEVNECSVCWERADALNSDGTGDRCSDTPLALIDGNGHAIGTNDVCSARPWPVSRLFNFMSAAPWFGGGFTAQQAGRMHGWITNRLSSLVDTNTPASPSEFRVVANGFGETELSWTDNSWNETGFRIERSADGTTFEVVTVLPPDATGFFDALPLFGASYYRITALNSNASTFSYSTPIRSVFVSDLPAPVVYADAASVAQPPDGSPARPYPMLRQAYDAAPARAIIRLQSGDYPETFILSNKVLRLEPQGGRVQIGRPPP